MAASTPGPVFEDYEPTGQCGCAGCADWRRLRLRPVRDGGHPAANGGARRALVAATAAGMVLGGGSAAAAAEAPPPPRGGGASTAADPGPPRGAGARTAAEPGAPRGGGARTAADPGPPRGAGASAAADPRSPRGAGARTAAEPEPPRGAGASAAADPGPLTEQGSQSGLHGAPGHSAHSDPQKLKPLTRTEIINRAKTWVAAAVPYNMDEYWSDGYRQDCSGYVSMAWDLGTNEWTGSLADFGVRTTKEQLQPGDMLLFHNPTNPTKGSHVVLFGGWTDHTHNYYTAYEETPPGARTQATPYAYWKNSASYVPYRYKAVVADASGGATAAVGDAFPGAASFGPGANNAYVTRLGQMLIQRGGARFYTSGPGPRWSTADLNATRAFQQAQGWTGAEADGIPGPATWTLLVQGGGKDIPPAPPSPATAPVTGTAPGTATSPATSPPKSPATAPVTSPPTGTATAPVTSPPTGTATAPVTSPPTGTATAPVTGTATSPSTSPATVPATAPGTGSGTAPTTGAATGPATSPATGSTTGAATSPVTGAATGPATSPPTSPPTAAATSPVAGPVVRPAPGPILRPAMLPAPGPVGVQAARPGYPGLNFFRPGQDNAYVTLLGRQLVEKGFGRYFTSEPGARWSEEDRRNVEAFQRAQGWSGGEADGYPGPETWRRLFA
ncbi:peptidoglycan-binding protein [Streptomyces sp. NPDC006703]|uniref:peptidoglycan-binding protein n=1 Tax=Streptomyces sp. NPDC006703 TaxID=3364759 RepID=UPI00367EE488